MNYTVRIKFQESVSGSVAYILPHVFSVSDPIEGMKVTVIPGKRGDGSIVISGGKKSQKIEVEGIIWEDGYDYKTLTTAISTMRSSLTTEIGTLTMEHLEDASWVTDWQYLIRRIDEVDFPTSLRTSGQKYKASFLVVSY